MRLDFPNDDTLYHQFLKYCATQNYETGTYLERHRIVPGHLGGEYVEGNVIYLTLEHHRLAHYYAWLSYGYFSDKVAWQMMSGYTSSDIRS